MRRISVIFIITVFLLCGCTAHFMPEKYTVMYDTYEQYAQAIKDGSHFMHRTTKVYQSIKEVMQKINVIKFTVNGEELGWSGRLITTYPDSQYYRDYRASHIYKDYEKTINFLVEYNLEYTDEPDISMFPEFEDANYDAVINGQNVKVYYQQYTSNPHARFYYKNMYLIAISCGNKELLEYILNNLTIEEISVK
ncbi:MAG: hypothetical protein IKK58_00835 [Clostridia bacterium]|nr:hypothetical protein [Clostridia bacterium]